MISYISGKITTKSPTFLDVETHGVGYRILISLNTYRDIEQKENVKILTHLLIKEDSHTLYGFSTEDERFLFKSLISVSGIGPGTALLILSALSSEEVRAAIAGEDVLTFNKIKGIGPKTAKRIILDLKDKILKDGGSEMLISGGQGNTVKSEALSALIALGFNRQQVQKAVNAALNDDPSQESVEGLIKLALGKLSK